MYQVYRSDLSSYHQSDFRVREAERLNSIDGVAYVSQTPESEQIILLTNTHTQFEQMSESFPDSCRLIVHANSGYDNLPLEIAARANLEVIVGNPIRAGAVASYVLTQLFSHFNPSPHAQIWQQGRQWDRPAMNSLSILLLGYGHISKLVHSSLQALGCEILIHDPFLGVEVADLQDRLQSIDVIIPLMSLNPTSKYFINETILRALPSNFVLINGARGDLIDQQALLAVLHDRPDAFAYLDVFRDEPFDCGEFRDLENVRLSSHVAGVFTGIDEKIIEFEHKIIHDFTTLKMSEFRVRHEHLLLHNRIFDYFLI